MDRLVDPDLPSQVQLNNIRSGKDLFMSPVLFYCLRNKVEKIKNNPFKSDVFSLGMVTLQAGLLESVQSVYDFESNDIDEAVIVELVERFIDKYPKDVMLQEMLLIMLEFSEDLRMSPKRLLNLIRELRKDQEEKAGALVDHLDIPGSDSAQGQSSANRSLVLKVKERLTDREMEQIQNEDDVVEEVMLDQSGEKEEFREIEQISDNEQVEEIPIIVTPQKATHESLSFMKEESVEKVEVNTEYADQENEEEMEEEMVEMVIPTQEIIIEQVQHIENEIEEEQNKNSVPLDKKKTSKQSIEVNIKNMIENESIEIKTDRYNEIKNASDTIAPIEKAKNSNADLKFTKKPLSSNATTSNYDMSKSNMAKRTDDESIDINRQSITHSEKLQESDTRIYKPQKPLKHVVRYRKTSPSPSTSISRFIDAPVIQINQNEVSHSQYISGKVPVFTKQKPENIHSENTMTSPRIIRYTSPYKQVQRNEIKSSFPGHGLAQSEEVFMKRPVAHSPRIVKTSYSVIHGEVISKKTIPSDAEREKVYSRRFKHLKLVESTKDYKRYQYTTKSREKVNWSWKRDVVCKKNIGNKRFLDK